MKYYLILPPPPDTVPDMPAVAPYVSESDTWRAIEETAKETVRPGKGDAK